MTVTLPVVIAVTISAIKNAEASDPWQKPREPSSRALISFSAILTMIFATLALLQVNRNTLVQATPGSRRSISRVFLLLQLVTLAVPAFQVFDHARAYRQANWARINIYEDHYQEAQFAHQQWAFSANVSTAHSIALDTTPKSDVTSDYRSKAASTSAHLYLAVEEYRALYGRYPPPGFDAWHKYATARGSLIINSFDSIWNDLRPFYALEPAEIRARTYDLITDHRNDIVGVSIRDGRAHAGPNIPPRHQWMVEGILKMINKFAEHLPDMDLAFNINEASRVVVPNDRMDYLQRMSEPPVDGPKPQNQYQPGRTTHWPRLTGNTRTAYVMQELGANDNIYRYATAGCKPDSPARQQHSWNRGTSRMQCPSSKSVDSPLHEVDVCSQPDLQYMHGFYSASPVFKATHKLYPVFSYSKAPGFSDILYPNVWDYMDKSVYAPSKQQPDPAWSNKTGDIFWRGITTEGVSDGKGGAKWQGMLRQRFVHFANNVKGFSPSADLLDLVRNRYMPVSAKELTELLPTDVQISQDIARCAGRDCDVQRWEFAPTPEPLDFQENWSHKYLLDMDGATASTSFLPFLRSRSLPFRASIMQEWWRDRVTPWVHYVPLDVRGCDFWTTLAYYAGIDGFVNGRHIQLDGHDEEAELIANAGKEWADSVLRKEDMEIYFFRLLLEWARITDDWRDDIGFTGTSD